MSLVVVAKRELLELRRSRGLWTLLGLATVTGLAAVVLPAIAIDGSLGTEQAVRFVVAPMQLVIGLTGLLAGYSAVAGPRSGGQLKLVLGLPIHRASLVIGAALGRMAFVIGGVIAALITIALAMQLIHGSLAVAALGGFGVLLAVLAAATTSLAVGVSAASPSRWIAAMAVVALFVLFQFFWGVVPAGVHYLIEGSVPGQTVPPWVVLLERLHPFAAFRAATDLVLPEVERTIRLSGEGAEAPSGGPRALGDRVRGPVPWYLSAWAALGTLLGWAVVPLVIGLHRFTRADL
ncbi:MAG: ABC transporter permease subunit [Halobacteriales archaeon]